MSGYADIRVRDGRETGGRDPGENACFDHCGGGLPDMAAVTADLAVYALEGQEGHGGADEVKKAV